MNPSYGTVYLSGPMSGFSEEKQLWWRDVFHRACKQILVNTTSPMRSKDILPPRLYSSHASITERDLYDVRRCDMLVVNLLDAKHISMGTMIEMGVAYGLRTPIVTIMDGSNPHAKSEMIAEMSAFMVDNVKDAFAVVAAMLLPDDEIRTVDAEAIISSIISHKG